MTCGCRNQFNDTGGKSHSCDKDSGHRPPCRCRCGKIRTDDLPRLYTHGRDVVVEATDGPILVIARPSPDRLRPGDVIVWQDKEILDTFQRGCCYTLIERHHSSQSWKVAITSSRTEMVHDSIWDNHDWSLA